MAETEEKKIRLVNGAEVRVSAGRYSQLSEHRWYQFSNGYVYRRTGSRAVMMHREIAGATTRDVVLHADGDRLNCADENLVVRRRHDFLSERVRERNVRGTSAFRGVSWHTRSGRWRVVLRAGGKLHYIGAWEGTPEGELQAARAYDAAALRLVGSDARLNFPRRRRRRGATVAASRVAAARRASSRPAPAVAPQQEAPAGVAALYEKPVHELTPAELERMRAAFLGAGARTGKRG